LARVYDANELNGIEKLELLRNLSFNEVSDLDLSLKYAEELIVESLKENNYKYLYRGYLQKGNKHRLTGDFGLALAALFESEEAAIKGEYVSGEGIANMTIADTYSQMGNSDNAEIYYREAIEILRKADDKLSLLFKNNLFSWIRSSHFAESKLRRCSSQLSVGSIRSMTLIPFSKTSFSNRLMSANSLSASI